MSYMTNQESKTTTRFYPKNKNKFKSKTNYCICRSSWETKFCSWCDTNDQIVAWNSEAVVIPYYDPVKMKNRRYFPDYLIKVIDKSTRKDKIYLIEVKPYAQCIQPVKSSNKRKKTKIYEATTYATNKAKWIAAMKYCKLKGWSFKLITERELGI